MMQPADGHERAPAQALHDPVGGRKAGADHAGRGLIYPAKCRRIARVEPAVTRLRTLGDELQVFRGMKQQQLGLARLPRLEQRDVRAQLALLEFALEHAVPVWTERMAVAKPVTSQLLAEYDCNLRAWGVQGPRFELVSLRHCRPRQDITPRRS